MTKLSKTLFKMLTKMKNEVKILAKQQNKKIHALMLEIIYEDYESRKKGV